MFSKLLLINALVITNRQSQADSNPLLNGLSRLHSQSEVTVTPVTQEGGIPA